MNQAITKKDLVARMANDAEMSKADAEKALNAFMGAVMTILGEGDSVSLKGFGTFEAKHRKSRQMKNMKTSEMFMTEATNYPSFSAGSKLKEAVKK